jgi:hypothetical protein
MMGPASSHRNKAASVMFENYFPSLRRPQLSLSMILMVSPLLQHLTSGSASLAKKLLRTWAWILIPLLQR